MSDSDEHEREKLAEAMAEAEEDLEEEVEEEVEEEEEEATVGGGDGARATEPAVATAEVLTAEDVEVLGRVVPTLCAASACDADEGGEVLSAARALRSILSRKQNAPVGAVIDSGVLPALMRLLASPNSTLRFEVAWCLTNVASSNGRGVPELHAAGAVVAMLACVFTENDETVLDQILWFLANVAGENPTMRDVVLDFEGADRRRSIVPFLAARIATLVAAAAGGSGPVRGENAGVESPLHTAVWFASNLCRGKPPPQLEKLAPLLPSLKLVLTADGSSSQVIVDCLEAVSYISDGPNERIDAVITSGLLSAVFLSLHAPVPFTDASPLPRPHDYQQSWVKRLPPDVLAEALEFVDDRAALLKVAFACKDVFYDVYCAHTALYKRTHFRLLRADRPITKSAVRILGNVVTGNDRQTDIALQLGLLDVYETLVVDSTHLSPAIAKEINWALSNVTAGSSQQILAVASRPVLLEFVRDSFFGAPNVAKEASWVCANALSGDAAPRRSVRLFSRSGCFLSMLTQLRSADARVLSVVSEGFATVASHLNAALPATVLSRLAALAQRRAVAAFADRLALSLDRRTAANWKADRRLRVLLAVPELLLIFVVVPFFAALERGGELRAECGDFRDSVVDPVEALVDEEVHDTEDEDDSDSAFYRTMDEVVDLIGALGRDDEAV